MAATIPCPGDVEMTGFATQGAAEKWAKDHTCSTTSDCEKKKSCEFGYGAIKVGTTWKGWATCQCPEEKPKRKRVK